MLYVHTIGRIGKDCQVITGAHGSFIAFDIAVDDYSHGNSITTWVRVRSKKENHIRLSITADALEFINTGKREGTTSEAESPTDAASNAPVPPVAMPQEDKEDLPF